MKKRIAKTKRPEAERAGEWALIEHFGCVFTRRALRTKFARVDFYAADIIGKMPDGACVYAQVTAGAGATGAIRVRRRKLERYPWHTSERVLLLQLVETPDPADSRKKKWFFRVHEYHGGTWGTHQDAIPIPEEWFKASKEDAQG